jgi:hypothetical protein
VSQASRFFHRRRISIHCPSLPLVIATPALGST